MQHIAEPVVEVAPADAALSAAEGELARIWSRMG
jgi:assimilatory nitrate reductase catalytic subunit